MPTEALAIEARAAFVTGDHQAALQALQRTFIAYRTDPWPTTELMLRTLKIAPALVRRDETMAGPILDLLSEPFVTDSLRLYRQRHAVEVSILHQDRERCVQALAPFEPHALWERGFLELRLQCYERAKHPHARGRTR